MSYGLEIGSAIFAIMELSGQKVTLLMVFITVMYVWHVKSSVVKSGLFTRKMGSFIPRIPSANLTVRSVGQCASSCARTSECTAANVQIESPSSQLDCQLFHSYTTGEEITQTGYDVLAKPEGVLTITTCYLERTRLEKTNLTRLICIAYFIIL